MRIGIIGWYGHSNYGDERILHCLKQSLPGHELFVVGGWEDARKSLADLNHCDYVLIGGGGLILRGCHAHLSLIEQLKTPFSCVGISVEAEHRDMRPFLELLKTRAERIIVRDTESSRIFGPHATIVVAPDLTFLSPLAVVSPVDDEMCGLNLRPWFFWKAQLHARYHRFMARQSSRIPTLINYYPLPKWNPAEIVPQLHKHFAALVPMPFYFEAGVENDIALMQRFFSSVPSSFDELRYAGLRYIVAMRFHAIVFAVQAGIPFISLSYQPKNINFCKDLGLEELSVDIYRWQEQLPQKINYLKNNYTAIRHRLLERREQYVTQSRMVMADFVESCLRPRS